MIAEARSRAYSLFARAFGYPEGELLDAHSNRGRAFTTLTGGFRARQLDHHG